jgi:transposase
MGIEIRPDYTKSYLLPPCLEDWVGADHPSRFIRDFVDSLDLAELGFRVPEAVEGRPPYSVDLLLKVWLYGYTNRIRSSRKLERACREHMSLLWLTGNHHPDHNTLWRFWVLNERALRNVFRQSVLVAQRAGLIGLVLHALDGTKVRASVSRRKAWHRDDLEALLEAIEASLEEMAGQVERAEGEEVGEFGLPEEWRDAQKRQGKIKDVLAELSAMGRAHLHPLDKDARLMKQDGRLDFSFNAQGVVDEQSGLLVAEGVTNQETDQEQLVPMLEAVANNLGGTGQETVADGGYYSPGQLAEAEAEGYSVTVSMYEEGDKRWGKGEFRKANFTYDEKRDVYVCPMGQELTYERTQKKSHGRYLVRIYRCCNYGACSRRGECSQAKRGRAIERGEYEAALEHQRAKHQNPAKKELLQKRKALIETVFAQIKEHQAFRRWSVRGLEKVRTQWSMVCAAFNLNKLYKYWLAGTLSL